jgi:hypothetical protein
MVKEGLIGIMGFSDFGFFSFNQRKYSIRETLKEKCFCDDYTCCSNQNRRRYGNYLSKKEAGIRRGRRF